MELVLTKYFAMRAFSQEVWLLKEIANNAGSLGKKMLMGEIAP